MDSMIKRNKIILSTLIIAVVISSFCLILFNSSINGNLSFRHIINNNTGEPVPLLESVFLYILLFWIAGIVPSSAVCIFSFYIYLFLHRKDKRLFERRYHPPYEEELYFGAKVAFESTYIATFILMILHISGLFTIRVF